MKKSELIPKGLYSNDLYPSIVFAYVGSGLYTEDLYFESADQRMWIFNDLSVMNPITQVSRYAH